MAPTAELAGDASCPWCTVFLSLNLCLFASQCERDCILGHGVLYLWIAASRSGRTDLCPLRSLTALPLGCGSIQDSHIHAIGACGYCSHS